jgi:hypothetical protein
MLGFVAVPKLSMEIFRKNFAKIKKGKPIFLPQAGAAVPRLNS